MSLYMQSVQSGMSSLQLLATGSNAATKASYNEAYKVAASRFNMAAAKQTAQLNISAIEQDKVMSNTQIRINQNQAEANVIVQAAAAGVEGGTIDDIVYDSKKNEALAVASSNKQAENAKESQLAQIHGQQSALLSIDEPEVDFVGNLLSSLGSFELGDLDIADAFAKQ